MKSKTDFLDKLSLITKSLFGIRKSLLKDLKELFQLNGGLPIEFEDYLNFKPIEFECGNLVIQYDLPFITHEGEKLQVTGLMHESRIFVDGDVEVDVTALSIDDLTEVVKFFGAYVLKDKN